MRRRHESDRLHRRPGRDQEDTHLPGGQSPVSQTRHVAREPGAATGAFVRLTPGKPIVQLNRLRRCCKRQDIGWPVGRDRPESGAGEADYSAMMTELRKNS